MFLSMLLPLLKLIFWGNMTLLILLVLLERRPAANNLAWLLLLIFLPPVGLVLYLFLGFLPQHPTAQPLPPHDSSAPVPAIAHRSVYLNQTRGFPLSLHNEVQIFHDGFSLFADMQLHLQQAHHFVLLQSYIFADDALGHMLLQELIRCTQRKVAVYLLYDGIGCFKTPKAFFQSLQQSGGKIAAFAPLRLHPVSLHLNHRNHRKILVIDEIYGYVGGFNISEQYVNTPIHHWRDIHLCIRGEAVACLQQHFLADWQHTTGCLPQLPTPSVAFPLPATELPLQIIFSDPEDAQRQIQSVYLQLIHAAQQSIYIQSPYFIPDESILKSLQIAGNSGIDVRILLPAFPDHPLVFPCACSYMGELFPAHVRFYLYTKGFLHSKLLLIDGQVASVGSVNMDIRSFTLNSEVSVLLYDCSTVQELQAVFFQDIQDSQELTLETYQQRPYLPRLLEGFARLFSPLL